jgi:hypothetical protein
MADLEILPCTVAAGQTVSAPVSIGTKTVVGISMPSTWASGALKFNVSPAAPSRVVFCYSTPKKAVDSASPTPQSGELPAYRA